MRTGDKAVVKRGAYAGREVTLGYLHPDFQDFWMCALPLQKYDRKSGKHRDSEAATEVMLHEAQMTLVVKTEA